MMERSSLSVGTNTLVNWWKGQPSAWESYHNLVSEITIDTVRVAVNQYKKQQELENLKFMNTPASQILNTNQLKSSTQTSPNNFVDNY
jgi:hypothetical protein